MTPDEMLAEMERAGFEVRQDQLKDGRYRVRVEIHTGRTFHDYRATTTSTAAATIALGGAYRRWRTAMDAGEIEPPYGTPHHLLARADRVCRACGCTDEWGRDEGSWWVEADLCSSCQGRRVR